MGYETEAWRAPSPKEGERPVFSEHGRGLNGVCYRSHWFILVKSAHGSISLLVKHGAGEERVSLHYKEAHIDALAKLSSDERFLLFWSMLQIKHDAERTTADAESVRYKQAFVEGRLRKRKQPGESRHRVWIEPKVQSCTIG